VSLFFQIWSIHLYASVMKQYNLVLVKGRWRSEAGKVIVDLAMHWPRVTDLLVVYQHTSPRPMKGRWAPAYSWKYGPLPLPFYLQRGWPGGHLHSWLGGWLSAKLTRKSKVLPKPPGPIGQRWSSFPIALSQTPAYTACLFTPQLSPAPSYTAWWQRHTGVSSLPKATAQWCRGRTQTRDL